MGYTLRMHAELRDWLTNLRTAEPGLARLVGEAVLALIEAGDSLGPPLVVPPGTGLPPPDDPRAALDYSYQRQLELLQKVRRGVADVATSRKRLELQIGHLEQSAARLASQCQEALDAGHKEEAAEARTREQDIRQHLSDLNRQLSTVAADETKLTTASQRLQAKVDRFRTRKETIKATYTTAEAVARINEAFAEAGTTEPADSEGSDAEPADAQMPVAADASPGSAGTSTAASELVVLGVDPAPGTSEAAAAPADQGGVVAPPGMMELRPGATGSVPIGLLYALDPPGTAVVVAWTEGPVGSPEEYQETIRVATARIASARAAGPQATAASSDVFVSYDAETFLDEFFPGEGTEVEVGAAALAARSRAHTLAQARERMMLTQAQVATRMNVRLERVRAIESAEPGATEVRTLAAYVHALGGLLEITADIGGERMVLR